MPLLTILLVVTFAVHLAAVNIASAGPLVCALVDWRGRARGGAIAGAALVDAGQRLARLGLVALAFGIMLGFGLLAILWAMGEDRYLETLGLLPAGRWWFAAAEVAFYYVCMTPYAVTAGRAKRSRAWLLLPLLAATNLLYHFPPLFGVVSVAVERDEFHGLELTREAYRQIVTDPQTLSRIVHHWLAAVAMAGLAFMWLGVLQPRTTEASKGARPVLWGSRIALLATVIQLPVGLWVVLQLPAGSQEQLLGEDAVGTALLGVSLLGASLLLQALATVALGDTSRAAVRRCVLWMAVVLVLMSGTLHRVRGVRMDSNAGSEQGPARQTGPTIESTPGRVTPRQA
jgi:hypothetical protein